MTDQIQSLLKDKRAVITPKEAAEVLNCGRYAINVMVKNGQCPFPAMMIGTRVKIPRVPFLQYLGYLKGEAQ